MGKKFYQQTCDIRQQNTILSYPEFSNDLSDLPTILIFDMYKFFFMVLTMQGYTMAQDGYVLDLQVDNSEYLPRLRTRENDPFTKLPHLDKMGILSIPNRNDGVLGLFCAHCLG